MKAVDSDESQWGPKVRLVRFRPEKAFWNPNQSNKLVGQSVESIKPTDGLEADYFPRCGFVRIRQENYDANPRGDVVYVPFQGCYHAVAKKPE